MLAELRGHPHRWSVSGTLKTAVSHTPQGAVSLAGLGSFAISANVFKFGSARFAGSGGFAADVTPKPLIHTAARLAGAGALHVSALQSSALRARFQGAGHFVADAFEKPLIQISASLHGLGEFKSAAEHTADAAALFAGQSALHVKIQIQHPGQAEPCRLVDVGPEVRFVDVSLVVSRTGGLGVEDRYIDVDAENRYADLPACGLAA